ncbi:MAG: hypothetical protein M3Z21_13935 [Pseudomonadota bacterium]|nr:hypothetical protein [Pseudomonadota bacterium]
MPARPKKTVPQNAYDIIEKMAARGCRELDIARSIGLGDKSWPRILKEDPKAAEAFDKGRGQAHDVLMGQLFKKALDGDTACLLFALKVLFGYRENNAVETDHRVRVEFVLPGALTPGRYQQALAEARALPHGPTRKKT